MHTRTLHVTVIQDAPRPRDLAANLRRVTAALASSADTDLLLFPELFLSGYQTAGLAELALTHTDPRVIALATACRDAGTALLVGCIEAAPEGFFDAILAIDRDGTVRGMVRKTHLFGNESEAFRAGDTLTPITLCETTIGVVNCFEIEFPEVARTLVLRGAQLIAAGSANMHPYTLDHRIAATARALENRVPVAYANRVGTESGHEFCGGSRLVMADGGTLAELDSATSGVISGNLSLTDRSRTAATPPDPLTDMLSQRRPALYAR
ncbi:5-aminopentanamidase / Aliphatic amidase AmiE [Leucobacter sp. 7(1)]|uniref:nitrilase-related carbon-nitrogen hydrolase n=1 Tax=Leucobacter sp. 7(1) TaxID=1255613 RepID=UPI00097F3FF6|nr:nitrilase-related carbon-nitrogen hydrolase [Leucobacter sp. 7(1)]SJN08536.1 5-aminopentanamidase / Aliphatic amidase AmiE [Leucobacter sp. 7(1)]